MGDGAPAPASAAGDRGPGPVAALARDRRLRVPPGVLRHAAVRPREAGARGARPWADPSGYAERVADQGIGRALWFVCGADVERLATVIGEFAPARRSDLWSGAGLAAAYAGGIEADEAETLLKLATGFRGELAQGCAFAAEARLRADLVTPDTRTAAQVFCRTSVEAAAAVTQDALVDLPSDGPVPAYELWRQRIRAAFEDVGG
ncbi:DUF1702 family protein [Actinomadura yumaensis]|uniref:DUF1702 family protein n=1 Tax=Actinomadura yumaensis TaxID=111807 RepID=UPI003606C3A7